MVLLRASLLSLVASLLVFWQAFGLFCGRFGVVEWVVGRFCGSAGGGPANLYRVQNPIKVGKPQRSDGFKPPDMPKESRVW